MNETIGNSQIHCPQCNNLVDADAKFCKNCAYALSNSAETSTTDNYEIQSKNYFPFIFGGVGLLVLIIIGTFVFYTKSNPQSTNTNINTTSQSTSSIVTIGSKAQEVEAKILRGEAVEFKDIEGIPPQELRILRNAHFAKYGRKYEKPGLGDYFFTRPWYKPSDNYNENLLTTTDKLRWFNFKSREWNI